MNPNSLDKPPVGGKPRFCMAVLEIIAKIPRNRDLADRYLCGYTWKEGASRPSETLETMEATFARMSSYLCWRDDYRYSGIRIGAPQTYLAMGTSGFIVSAFYESGGGGSERAHAGFAIGDMFSERGRRILHLEILCSGLRNEYYKKHSGVRLVEKVIEYAKENGVDEIRLTALPDAVGFYLQPVFDIGSGTKVGFSFRRNCARSPELAPNMAMFHKNEKGAREHEREREQYLKGLVFKHYGTLGEGFEMRLCLSSAQRSRSAETRYKRLAEKHLGDPRSPVYRVLHPEAAGVETRAESASPFAAAAKHTSRSGSRG